MSINAEISDALEELEIDCGDADGVTQKFTWYNNATVPCIPSYEERGLTITVGSAPVEVQLTLNVRKSNFLTADSTLITVDSTLFTGDSSMRHPITSKKLIFRGRSYRIATAAEDPSRAYWKLVLIDPNR